MKNEMSVAEFYAHTTAVFCVNVASVLALLPMFPGLLPDWLNVLCWTFVPSKSGYAIADGSLQIRVIPMDSPKSEAEKLLYGSPLWQHLQRISKALGDLAIWEFKSLSVGDHPTMLGIRNEAFTRFPFRWETIDNDERESVRRRYEPPSVSLDAKTTPWTLPLPDSDSNENSGSSGEQGHGQGALQPLPGETSTEIQAEQRPASPIRFSSSPLSSVPSSGDNSEAAGQGQIVQPSQGEVSTATQITGVRSRCGKSRGRGRGEAQGLASGSLSSKKRKRDDDDENYKSKQELTAASLIQQAWAQAVRHDATLIIIQSGNSEYVCVRHRATQTLYVSDLIDVPNCENPGYARLHTGIYITALLDAMQRVAPSDDNVDPSSNIGGTSEDGAGDGGHPKDPKQRGSKGNGREHGNGPGLSAQPRTNDGARDDLEIGQNLDRCEDERVEQIIMECNKRNGLLMHFQYGIYDSPVPAAFIRAVAPLPTPPPSPQRRRVFQSAERLVVVITSEIGTGATGVVHGGTLEVELPGQSPSLDVVAKLAFSDHQKERLAHENAIYRYLSSKRITGIPTLLGFFNSVDGGPSTLLMTHSGVSVSSNTQPLLSTTREGFLVILQEIHKVGILHDDIRCENLLIDSWGHASIIDFDQAKKSSSARAMEEEFLHLIDLLNSLTLSS